MQTPDIKEDTPVAAVARMRGSVKWFDGEVKGFGFIVTEDIGPDWFFHVTSLRGREWPEAGDEVEFTPQRDARGRNCAQDVVITETAR